LVAVRCPPQLARRRVLQAAPRCARGASRKRFRRRRITVRVPRSVQRKPQPPRAAAAHRAGLAAVAATVASIVATVASGCEQKGGAAAPALASADAPLSRPAVTDALWEALDAANGECRRAARQSRALEVSVLLCTVTFHANLAHSLTRSP
jgi:hypothetical protein